MEENVISKSIGILLYKIKEQTKDILVLKKLSESNLIIKDPDQVINLINNQLSLTQDLIHEAYSELYGILFPKEEINKTTEEEQQERKQPIEKKETEKKQEIKEDKEEIIEEESENNNVEQDKNSEEDLAKFIDTEYVPVKKKNISEELKKKLEEL